MFIVDDFGGHFDESKRLSIVDSCLVLWRCMFGNFEFHSGSLVCHFLVNLGSFVGSGGIVMKLAQASVNTNGVSVGGA